MRRSKPRTHMHCVLTLDMMKKLGFNMHCISVVMGMVSSISFLIMFNRKNLEEFKTTKGHP